MKLGAFSVSLAVKDLGASREFYEALGFRIFAGTMQHGYLIMKNGETLIGLFQGMFDRNMLTFNPGWDQSTATLDTFTDVCDLQKTLKSNGMTFEQEADEEDSGPGSFIVADPDGNPVLVDQHV